jgi:tetratricopeptide (TPR) repeat protein
MLTLLELYQILKEIAGFVSFAKDLQVQGLDSQALYLRALGDILSQEKKVFFEKGISFDYNIEAFGKKLRRNGVVFEQLSVSPEILNEQIGSQVARWMLDSGFLMGVDIGVEVDSGWAERVAYASIKQYATLLVENLFNDATRQELQFIASKVKDNPKIQDDVKLLLSLSQTIISKLTPEYTSLNPKAVQELFGVSASLVEVTKIEPATQERLRAFYQGGLLWWDIIVADGDVERDLQESILANCLSYPENVKILCFDGEPGAGKSTLAWRVAANISRRLSLPLIHQRNNESEDFWFLLENGVSQYGKPVIVLVDDIFRDPNAIKALASINPNIPILIISTSRLNEKPDDLLMHINIAFIHLQPPTNDEIVRALEKTKHKSALRSDQIKRLKKATTWLVLMYEMTTGEELSKRISDSVKRLKIQDEVVYKVYEYLCFAGQFDLDFPVDLLGRLDNNGEFHNIVDRPAAKGLIYYTSKAASAVRVQHSVIAKFALKIYRRDPRNLIKELIIASDPSIPKQGIFIASLLLQFLAEKQHELISSILIEIDEIEDFEKKDSLAELSLWIQIFQGLGQIQQAKRLELIIKNRILSGSFSTLEEWMIGKRVFENKFQGGDEFSLITARWLQEHPADYLIRPHFLTFVTQKGIFEQIQKAIQSTAQWLQHYPDDYLVRQVYLRFVEQNGSHEQIQGVIQSTDQWLNIHTDDYVIRPSYLGLVQRWGNPEQIKDAIQSTTQWLQEHSLDTHVRQSYLSLVERWGNPEKIEEVFRSSTQWLQDHPSDTTVRASYLGLVERWGNPEKIEEVVRSSTQWLQDHPSDTTVRPPYLSLVERWGNPEQIKEAIQSTAQWLQDHPSDTNVRQSYLSLVKRWGDPEEIEEIVRSTTQWLQDHPSDTTVRPPYLSLVERWGNPEQIKVAIQSTAQWLQDYPSDTNVRQSYLGLVTRQGDPVQIGKVIQSTSRWLQDHNSDATVRQTYMGLVERWGNPEQIKAAIQSTAQWLQDHPSDTNVRPSYLGLVTREGNLEQIKDAIQATAQWLKSHPREAIVQLLYLSLIANKGSQEQITNEIGRTELWIGSDHYTKLDKITKANVLAKYARMLLKTQQYTRAEEISNLSLIENSGFVPARINLAWSYYYQDKKTNALEELNHSLWWAEKFGKYPIADVYYQLGRYWLYESQYSLAEAFFEKAIQNCDTSFNPYKYYIRLGKAHIMLKEHDSALIELQKAKELISDKLVDRTIKIELDILLELALQRA